MDILLATYNGAAFIRDQILSIQQQDYGDWRLLVRDDGSLDDTVALVGSLAARDPRILLVESDKPRHLGINGNFRRLMELANARYVMFCDQDDWWLPGKVRECLHAMQNLQRAHPGRPCLVHCDAAVTDSALRPLAPRFIGRRGLASGFSALLLSNPVQGATAMINSRLRDLALQVEWTLPYDYVLALIAQATGERWYLDKPLISYRQHGTNAIGIRAGPNAAAGDEGKGRLSRTLRIGLEGSTLIPALLQPLRGDWHPDVAPALQRHRAVLQPGFSVSGLWWALLGGYQFFRRIDRLNLILYKLGLPSLTR